MLEIVVEFLESFFSTFFQISHLNYQTHNFGSNPGGIKSDTHAHTSRAIKHRKYAAAAEGLIRPEPMRQHPSLALVYEVGETGKKLIATKSIEG